MGFSFHPTGYVKRAEDCWNESRAINASASPRAAKTKEKPAGLRWRALQSVLSRYELRDPRLIKKIVSVG
jgi:hypothetical protein